MTNQTIDGVPRDDLELVLLHGHSTHESDQAWDRLRALLDAPDEPSKFVGAAQYWSENEQALRDVCRFEGMKGLVYQVVRDLDGRASKPQGEPVAWAWVDEKGEHGVTHRWDVAKHLPYFVKPLYAEQPAPVAVVLPERKSVNTHNSHDWDEGHTDGWNAYDAELKRLNPSL